jgi:hypothetical protein
LNVLLMVFIPFPSESLAQLAGNILSALAVFAALCTGNKILSVKGKHDL